jgi:hypothetical protein
MEVILDKIYRFQDRDSKTNCCIPFSLEKDYEILEFICTYTPKVLEDEGRAKKLIEDALETYVPAEYREGYGNWKAYLPVLNLLTLSVDYEKRYLGCAHRHDSEQWHRISAQFSSPGFLKQPVLAGGWRALINIHAVVTGHVYYHLRINAYTGDEANHDSL